MLLFGKIKSRGYPAFLEAILVGFDLNLIAFGVIYNFFIPSPVSFIIASLDAEYSGISKMANSQREQQLTEARNNRKSNRIFQGL